LRSDLVGGILFGVRRLNHPNSHGGIVDSWEILKLDESCISDPKSEISDWTSRSAAAYGPICYFGFRIWDAGFVQFQNSSHPPGLEFRYRITVNNVSDVDRPAADFAVFDIGLAAHRHVEHHW